MKVTYPSDTLTHWKAIQHLLKTKLSLTNKLNYNTMTLVAGVDISFNKKDPSFACAYITIIETHSHKILYEDHLSTRLTIPYVSGFLAFREVPHYAKLIDRIPNKYRPDVILVDGFGILHYRGFGSASHLGVTVDIPTIGVGKKLLVMDGLNERAIIDKLRKSWTLLTPFVEIVGKSGKMFGYAYAKSKESRPIYISVGHMVDIETAFLVVKSLCFYRVPEPIRISDIRSKFYLDPSVQANCNDGDI